MTREVTAYVTEEGLTVYDLDVASAELWAVAGPSGVDPDEIDTDNLPEGFRWVSEEEWDGGLTEPKPVLLEVCSNTEWLRENFGLDLDLIPDGQEDEAAQLFRVELEGRLIAAGFDTAYPHGQRILYHGWNGAQFTHNMGPVGTFSGLTTKQVEQVFTCIEEALKATSRAYPA